MTTQERLSEGDHAKESSEKGTTTGKVASESVTDEQQAARYEPKFTSFSSLDNQRLSAIDSGKTVAELVLEDRQEGEEHTAAGLRHVPRQSFMDGLKVLMQQTNSPEHEKELAGLFSLKYILEKTGQWCGSIQESISSALDALLKPHFSNVNAGDRLGRPIVSESTPTQSELSQPQETQILITESVSDKDFVLIASTQDSIPARASANQDITAESLDKKIYGAITDLQKAELQKTTGKQTEAATRGVDVDYAHGLGLLTNAPPDVLAIAAHADRGHLLEADEWLGGILSVPSERVMPIDSTVDAINTHRQNNPKAPPLSIIVACHSGVGDDAFSASVASQIALRTHSWVLGSVGYVDRTTTYAFEKVCTEPSPKGRGYVLFDPLGRQVQWEFHNPMTVEDWKIAKQFANLPLKE
jgi:hypothetical protein